MSTSEEGQEAFRGFMQFGFLLLIWSMILCMLVVSGALLWAYWTGQLEGLLRFETLSGILLPVACLISLASFLFMGWMMDREEGQ